jgi:hypothetical protein
MASAQNDTYVIGATMMTLAPLGASVFPTMIKSPSISGGQLAINAIATGATVAVLTSGVSGLNVGGATALAATIVGYPLASTDVFSWVGPAAFYIASAGSTAQIKMMFEYSAGATLA